MEFLKYFLAVLIAVEVLWFVGYAEQAVPLRCVCDSCWKTNYTCFTNESCLTTLKRSFFEDEGVKIRGCVETWLDQVTLCESRGIDTQYVAYRCCYYDLCNYDDTIDFPNVKPTSSTNEKENESKKYGTNMKEIIIAGVLSFVILVSWVVYKYKRKLRPPPAGWNCEASSGGSGLPILVQSTVARQIDIVQLVGRGRFGQVYRAKWNGEDVAVKSFDSNGSSSWARETEIYQTVMLGHENILGFIASDSRDNGFFTQLWLITDYHGNGSLYDYLQRVTLDVEQLLKLAHSAARGLAHLHKEIIGATHGKPAMAHRDIKSRNVLVKNDGTCCIADLGLAVRKTLSSQGLVDVPVGNRVGTSRYLAPEFLRDFHIVSFFDGYKRADVYSFGLVLWEMTRRCVCEDVCEDYQLPYYDKVSGDPSVEDVYEVVCVEEYRPLRPDRWQRHPILHKLSRMMDECWKQEPLARLTAARVKKSLQKYINEIN